MVIMPSAIKAEREALWEQMCPYEYKHTYPTQLDKKTLAKVLAWKFNRRGLIIAGPTRTGKTRMAWLLMRRLFVEECIWIETLSSVSFSHDCARKFMDGTGEDWVERLGKAKVLFFDDLGKFKFTERVESELFGLIEDRTSWGRPIIVTTNMSGELLKGKMTSDRGEPLVARLREFCDIIVTSPR
jgi:DNA replication protein DnaC